MKDQQQQEPNLFEECISNLSAMCARDGIDATPAEIVLVLAVKKLAEALVEVANTRHSSLIGAFREDPKRPHNLSVFNLASKIGLWGDAGQTKAIFR